MLLIDEAIPLTKICDKMVTKIELWVVIVSL